MTIRCLVGDIAARGATVGARAASLKTERQAACDVVTGAVYQQADAHQQRLQTAADIMASAVGSRRG